jgi:ferric iron reductase protein FhuF
MSNYEFLGKPVQIPCGWVFVDLPQELSSKIREQFKTAEKSFGSLKTTAKIGDSEWQTAMSFVTESNSYTLPVKAAIRKKEKIELDKDIKVTIAI